MQGRCPWAGEDPLYQAYHDTEWGRPQRDGAVLFEMLILEGFQSGLSWITILRKREGFRRVFQGFDADILAGWTEVDMALALQDPGIVRHRGKVEALVKNARAYLAMGGAEAFASYVWAQVNGVPLQRNASSMAEVPGQTEISQRFSKDLKRAGFGFCGPTTVYAFMQAAGLVNDHLTSCPCHAEVMRLG